MKIPSKKLIKNVLNIQFFDKFIEIENNTLKFSFYTKKILDENIIHYDYNINIINIFELCFKIKEWAYSKGYIIKTKIEGYTKDKKYWKYFTFIEEPYNYNLLESHFEICKNEIAAIIQGGEWVLSKINNK